MENFWVSLQNINYANIPLTQIILVVLVLIVTSILRRIVPRLVAKSLDRLVSKTGRQLGDELLSVVKVCTSLVLLIAGFWVIKVILSGYLSDDASEAIYKVLNLSVIFVIAYFIYRTASLFGRIMVDTVFHTDTELDDLLRLFVPKVFQAIAIFLLVLKGAELFLGASAAALVGILGGAGITLGLLLKDMIYDWFCTVIIYTDNLYKEGDWLFVSGLSGFVKVVSIGFRSTTLLLTSYGSVTKIPNSKMITGIVENWSQETDGVLMWGINWDLKIDGISASQTARICDGIKALIPTVKGLAPKNLVRFSKIEGNARVINLRAFVDDPNLYFDAEKDLNLQILQLLEQEGIDTLHVELRTEPETYKKNMKALQN
ncbi:MAG: mechanosensitive ion channel domain-containing protein [Microcoleaceae cyanobacterium]